MLPNISKPTFKIMPTKMFKNMGLCPHTKAQIDSPTCRQCKYYYRTGTNPFIWCCHPVPERAEEEPKKVEPLKPKTAFGKPVSDKPKEQQEKTKKETGKRPGRPKKDKNKPTTTEKRHKRATNAKQAKR